MHNTNIAIPTKNQDVLISVGIPTYNRPDDLRRTLGEMVGQTYRNIEIIVSDNASTSEEVAEVVREFASIDTRVKYFRQPVNIGPVVNFQFVLEKATGECFMWVADDDWHENNFIEELYGVLSGDDSAVVAFCNFDSRDDFGQPVSGYPNFLVALQAMCETSTFLRQLKFFLLKEDTAKPHAIYGLIRRKVLLGFSWPMFIEQYGWNGADALFVFWLMTKGRLALSEQRLFGCTVGNKKEYTNSGTKWGVRSYLLFIGQQVRYLYSYLIVARGVSRIAIAIFFPWKLLGVINLFAIQPGMNYLKKRLVFRVAQ